MTCQKKKRSVLWQHALEGGRDELTVISDRGFFLATFNFPYFSSFVVPKSDFRVFHNLSPFIYKSIIFLVFVFDIEMR